MKVGDRIKVRGGYDEDSPLRIGTRELRGTVVAFLPGYRYEPAVPAAVVRLDAPLTINGVTGAVLIMEPRYEGASWEAGEPGTQTVGLALCSEIPAGPAPQSGHGIPFETHAVFETL